MGLVLNTLTIVLAQPVSITAWVHTVPAGTNPNPTLANAVRAAACDAMTAFINAGAGPGKVRVRQGSTTLVDIIANDPCFPASVNGVATADVTPEPTGIAVAAGTADNYQVLDSDNTLLWSSSAVSAAP